MCPEHSSRYVPGEAAQDQDSSRYMPREAVQGQDSSIPEALFHLLNKVLLLKHLRELKVEKTVNGKAFYKSYIKWEELNQMQRNKTISFWVSNVTDGICYAIKTYVEAGLAYDNAEEVNRASITNMHNKAHLLHLFVDPTAAVLWSEALCKKAWMQLDDHDGQGGMIRPTSMKMLLLLKIKVMKVAVTSQR
jgi:hypothetical protein